MSQNADNIWLNLNVVYLDIIPWLKLYRPNNFSHGIVFLSHTNIFSQSRPSGIHIKNHILGGSYGVTDSLFTWKVLTIST